MQLTQKILSVKVQTLLLSRFPPLRAFGKGMNDFPSTSQGFLEGEGSQVGING